MGWVALCWMQFCVYGFAKGTFNSLSDLCLFAGDRRFSPWKGSVVDSVVGVFLTQNVSDHLSR